MYQKIVSCFITLIMFSFLLNAQQILNPGDIAIVGFKSDNPDEFSFVNLVDLYDGTSFIFTDNGVLADGSFRGNEGTEVYTVSGFMEKGTVTQVTTTLSLSVSGDQLIVYQETPEINYIFAFQSNSTQWQSTASDTNTSALPPGLVNGFTAIAAGVGSGDLDEIDNAWYSGVNAGSKEFLLSKICALENWNQSNSNYNSGSTIPTSFTVSSETLPVLLSSFTAYEVDTDIVRIKWITESETNVLGFNLYKNLQNDEDTKMKLNNELILEGEESGFQTVYFYDDMISDWENTYYWLESISDDMSSELFGPIVYSSEGSFHDIPESHNNECLSYKSNLFPNPFNPNTTIRFLNHEAGDVTINIYNMKGQKINNFHLGRQEKGVKSFIWDGKNKAGNIQSSGFYIFEIKTSSKKEYLKGLLIK